MVLKRWKVNVNITILNQFNTVLIVRADTSTHAKIRAYNKAKNKYKTANEIKIISVREV